MEMSGLQEQQMCADARNAIPIIGTEKNDQPKKHPNKTHGLSKTRIYQIWFDMIRRCRDPRRIRYKDYGGRGISVCPEWSGKDGPPNFAKFMFSIGWYDGCNLWMDRKNNDLGYFPDNVRLVNPTISNRNKKMFRCNTTGYCGVFYHKKRKKFQASIRINKKLIWLGYHSTAREGAIARDKFIIENNPPGMKLQVLEK